MFTEISPYEMKENPFDLLDNDWALLTAGNEKRCNTMTVSWGQMGIMWNKPVANVYVRPQRYTREFMEEQNYFSLSFFEKGEHRKALGILGKKSGRDGDKLSETDVTVTMMDSVPAFAEARLVLVCRKLYVQRMEPQALLDPALDAEWYPQKDYHWMYVGEIEKAYIR